MGRTEPGTYRNSWKPPAYEVDDNGKVADAEPHDPHNWGRWGPEDQRGTANLITAQEIVNAAALIKTGEMHSLAIPIDADAPVHYTRPKAMRIHTIAGSDFITGSPANTHLPGQQWTDDIIIMALQGSTQWDGLAHFLRDDCMYNGWWAGLVTAAGGAARNGIEHQRESLVGRGVLLDVCGHRGGTPLPGGYVITPEALDAVAASQGTMLRRGDIVTVRTGHLGLWYTFGGDRARQDEWFTTEPGLSGRCAAWAKDRDIAGLAIDNWAIDVVPFEPDATLPFPFHQAAIPGVGLTCGEFWWLDDLAAACARAGRYEFFLAAQPLYVVNASGSMLNPIAIL